MKKFYLFLVLILFAGFVFTDKVVPLHEIMKPEFIAVSKGQIYIAEGHNIYIYSLDNLKLKKKFGKKGQGPGEFSVNLYFGLQIFFLPDKMYVISQGKISFFTFDGKFIEEKKHTAFFGFSPLYPLKSKFVGMGFKQVNKTNILTVNLYDSEIKKVKEIHSYEIGRGDRRKVLDQSYIFKTFENKIFVAGSRGFVINVFDDSAKQIYSIQQKYKNIKFKDKHREEVLMWYKTNPSTKQFYDVIKNILDFPTSFPAIRNLNITDNKVYVHTFLKRDNKVEFHVFDLKGKLLKRIWLLIVLDNPVENKQYYVIENNKLYQLVENEDEEAWELHVTDIE